MGKKEKELLAVLKQLGYKVSFVETDDPYLRGAGGWHSSCDKEIAVGNWPGKFKKMVLWHEATHAAQYCYGWQGFQPLGFNPTEVGQEDWLSDRSWYENKIDDWDIEREARYVEHSTKNQEILLSVLKRMADPTNFKHTHPSMVSEISEVEYKPTPPFVVSKFTCLLCTLVFCMGIFSPSPSPKVELIEVSTPACTQVSYDNGDC